MFFDLRRIWLMTIRVALTSAVCAFGLAACSLDAPSPLGGGGARVNGAAVSEAAADTIERSPPRRIFVETPGCRRAELVVDGGMGAEDVLGALSAMGVLQAEPGALTVRGGAVDLTAFGERLRCRDATQATTSAQPGLDFDDSEGVDLFAESRFGGADVEAATRFQSFPSGVGGEGPIDAAAVRPGSGFFRAQLGVYPSYPAAVEAWRGLIAQRADVFRGEPVVVQPFAGSYRLNVLRRTDFEAQSFCRRAQSAGAVVCATGPY